MQHVTWEWVWRQVYIPSYAEMLEWPYLYRDKTGCLPHVPVEVDSAAKEQVDEAGDVLLRTVGIGKANVVEILKLSCTM